MKRVHGVDGCPGGFAVVSVAAEGQLQPQVTFARSLGGLIATGETIAVDIPIGLPKRIFGPGRVAEQAVRPLLGGLKSSVFSMPARSAAFAGTYEEVCAAARATSDPPRAISRQAFGILGKVRELDALLSPANCDQVFECHAEVAFWRINGEEPPRTRKAAPQRAGIKERLTILEAAGFEAAFFAEPLGGIPLVDVVDAAAIALVARRCANGTAQPFPNPPGRDARGLPIAIWS